MKYNELVKIAEKIDKEDSSKYTDDLKRVKTKNCCIEIRR
jgi:hypothetical protein